MALTHDNFVKAARVALNHNNPKKNIKLLNIAYQHHILNRSYPDIAKDYRVSKFTAFEHGRAGMRVLWLYVEQHNNPPPASIDHLQTNTEYQTLSSIRGALKTLTFRRKT